MLKILLVGMASGRWQGAVREWVALGFETRMGLLNAEEGEKEVWRWRLRKLEELIVFGLIEGRVFLFDCSLG